jgi:hypothetical protein
LSDRKFAQLGCIAVALCCAAAATAQPDPSMGQGEASIAVRSDVKLGVKGTGGTTAERLSNLGQRVGDQMGEIRACYRKQVASSPQVIGALRVRIALDKGDKPTVEVTEQQGSSPEMVACVARALEKGHYHDVGRPAAAILSLEFDNSRAKGEAAMAERKEKLGHTESASADGGHSATWSSDGGQLRFDVRTDAGAPSGSVDLVMRAFQSGYAAFLDCRRKCEQGGVSPEGDIEAELNVDQKARAQTQLGAISVRHQRAPGCADRAFKRLKFESPQEPLHAHVTVHFAP